MRRNYRILSFLLSIALVMSGISVPAYAAENAGNYEAGTDFSEIAETIVTLEESETSEEQSTVSDGETDLLDEESESVLTEETTEDVSEESTEVTSEEETETTFVEETVESKVEVSTEIVEEITTAEENLNQTENELVTLRSEIFIDPLYEELVGREAAEAELAAIGKQSTSSVTSIRPSAVSHFTSQSAVAEYVRGQMVVRANTITCTVPYSLLEANDRILYDIMEEAIAYTEDCTGQEGDSLSKGLRSWTANGSGVSNGMQLIWTVTYYSTADEETQLTAKVSQIMDTLALDGKTEYEKVKSIHDYICDNVDYDRESDDEYWTKYTPYAALCNGTAVCQGYALAFYRLCKETGLSVRYIPGYGGGGRHGWNIVRIGDVYYNIDCTWDGQDPETNYNWFLLNEIDFVDHARESDYATDAFYEEYPMTEYSYGKDSISTLDKNNLSYTFTTIEDTTVSSAANGRPKLLIFFNSGCYYSQSTIKSLAEYDLEGVDIYAIDAQKNTKSVVEEFKNTYGSDSIVFSYNTASVNSSAMYQYIGAAGISGSFYYPVICYIDADNKLQYVTTGISSGRQIYNYLQICCEYKETEYTITYHLDGGMNHEENPKTFTARTETIVLKDAVKTGFAFKGWYRDAGFKEEVTEIAKGTKENIVLYAKFVKELEVTVPTKTTYVVGEVIDLTGGSVTHTESNATALLTNKMISGFSSIESGICTVTVTYKGCKTSFNVLIIDEPVLEADYGQTLSEVVLPDNEYGVYSWTDAVKSLDVVGENTCDLTFTPIDTETFCIRNDLSAKINVYRSMGSGATITVTSDAFTYNGHAYKPEVSVSFEDETLDAKDYLVSYENNINAGLATIIVTGQNFYKDNLSTTFEIKPAELVIAASDVTLCIGEELPTVYPYIVTGLADGEGLVKEPVFTVTAEDTTKIGIYEIIPSGAEATDNYSTTITYVNAKLQIAEEKVGYTVVFDVQGHGVAPLDYVGIKAGGVIESPQEPTEEGYAFVGWFKDQSCTKAWNFDTDTIQADTVLYAKWNMIKEDISFRVSEISDVIYTGKALKPAVKVYDGETLLKVNKDYRITYHNSTNVNATKAGDTFDEGLPYVTITGKGNYTDTIKINFNVLPAVIGDGSETPAAGVKLSYSDQLTVNTKKAVNPFKSIKSGRNMKKDVDYSLLLTAVDAKDADGNVLEGTMENGTIPKGSSGTFILTVSGIGNYTGSIRKTVVVTDKTHLLKNFKITLGKNLKKVNIDKYKDEWNGRLPVAYYDKTTKKYYAVANGVVDYETVLSANDVFTVKYGNTSLIYGKDFTVSYQNDDKTGKATMIIQGMGKYLGNKSVTFTLSGKTFSAKTVSVKGIEPQPYTGRPITQNDVELTYKDGSPEGIPLEYGRDYTITYTKHINKGKATMTFVAKDGSGYQGSFKKNFNITVAPISSVIQDESMQNISVEYDKAGVKPADKVILKNAAGLSLVYGKDYTLSYENYKAVADKNTDKAPTIVIKGKGNYGGDPLRVPFTIIKASLSSDKISVTVKEMAYNGRKAATYQYKPAVKVMDGKKALRQGKDYKIEYKYNTQENYAAYYFAEDEVDIEFMPRVVISEMDGSDYRLDTQIEIPLPIYQTKFAKNKLHVVISAGEYTGKQVSPEIAVYYSADTKKVKAAKNLTDEEAILAFGLEKLTKDTDYTVSFGKNITAGKNKGSVTISGKSPAYGGSVTVKFSINSKKIVW